MALVILLLADFESSRSRSLFSERADVSRFCLLGSSIISEPSERLRFEAVRLIVDEKNSDKVGLGGVSLSQLEFGT